MTQVLDGFYRAIPVYDQNDRVCKGNIKARTRMIILYYYANNQKHSLRKLRQIRNSHGILY